MGELSERGHHTRTSVSHSRAVDRLVDGLGAVLMDRLFDRPAGVADDISGRCEMGRANATTCGRPRRRVEAAAKSLLGRRCSVSPPGTPGGRPATPLSRTSRHRRLSGTNDLAPSWGLCLSPPRADKPWSAIQNRFGGASGRPLWNRRTAPLSGQHRSRTEPWESCEEPPRVLNPAVRRRHRRRAR